MLITYDSLLEGSMYGADPEEERIAKKVRVIK